jgi:hypothetical protein
LIAVVTIFSTANFFVAARLRGNAFFTGIRADFADVDGFTISGATIIRLRITVITSFAGAQLPITTHSRCGGVNSVGSTRTARTGTP